MNKKVYFLIAVAIVLAGVYLVFFTSLFQPKTIQIAHTSRSLPSARTGPGAGRIFFDLGDFYSLTDIKVVPLAALQTNKLAQPVWHLVSDEGSDDIQQFSYGEVIRSMDPAVAGAQAAPLEPGVVYRLFVAAGKVKGQHDFQLGPPAPPPATDPQP